MFRLIINSDMGDRNSNVSSVSISISMLAKKPKVLQTSTENESCSDTLYSECSTLVMWPFIVSSPNKECVHKGPHRLTYLVK